MHENSGVSAEKRPLCQTMGDSSFREQTKTGGSLFILRKTAVDKFRTGRAPASDQKRINGTSCQQSEWINRASADRKSHIDAEILSRTSRKNDARSGIFQQTYFRFSKGENMATP